MRIIGIDPGYDRLGVAVIETRIDSGKLVTSVLYSTCITSPKTASFGDRLFTIGKELETIITDYQPHESAIEVLYFSKNSTTALKVAESRGVVEYLLTKYTIPITEYHPNTIKLAITGNGSADKKAIALMIPKLVSITNPKKLDDELDALAVALTHQAHQRAAYPQV